MMYFRENKSHSTWKRSRDYLDCFVVIFFFFFSFYFLNAFQSDNNIIEFMLLGISMFWVKILNASFKK